MNKTAARLVRWIVCGLVILTGAADYFTFFLEERYQTFDMSALTILTTNDFIIFLVKFLVIFGSVYLLLNEDVNSDYWHYLWIMVAVYLIIFQAIGTINNRQVAESAPPVESAPSKEVRLQTGINFALVWAYYPIGFSMLCFWLWNIGWRRKV